MSFGISFGTRVRKSPFFDATVAAGVTHFSTYNHMYMPVSYGDSAAEYERLVNGVSMWDVAVQRQIELLGPDASALADLVSTRDLSTSAVGQGRYAPMVDHEGRLLNDPVTLRVSENKWWISIADSDTLQWCRAIAGERNMDVDITEPDVSPLAVQGPRGEDTVAALCGDWIRDIRFFWYHETKIEGIPVYVGRAGWSKQGGFELYLTDGSRGTELWNLVAEAGAPFGIGPGAPNYIERIESGLLSLRADTEDDTDPFEAGLGRYVNLDAEDFIGRDALVTRKAKGMRYEFLGVRFDGKPVETNADLWPITIDDQPAGQIRAACYSPRMGSNIATALVNVPFNDPGTKVIVHSPTGPHQGSVYPLPFPSE